VPEGVDPATITASYTDGVLEIRIPKAFEAVRPKTTKIEVAKG
jgi:HSP20 family molecular chaperone IbpA